LEPWWQAPRCRRPGAIRCSSFSSSRFRCFIYVLPFMVCWCVFLAAHPCCKFRDLPWPQKWVKGAAFLITLIIDITQKRGEMDASENFFEQFVLTCHAFLLVKRFEGFAPRRRPHPRHHVTCKRARAIGLQVAPRE